MRLTSPAFEEGGEIPTDYAVPGRNEIPPLEIDEVPDEAASLALLFEDIDSPIGPVTHWLVWNIPVRTAYLDLLNIPQVARIGVNGFGKVGYDGPEPPAGRHHYRFRLLALDTYLEAGEGATRQAVEMEMADHVLARAELTGYFEGPGMDPDSTS